MIQRGRRLVTHLVIVAGHIECQQQGGVSCRRKCYSRRCVHVESLIYVCLEKEEVDDSPRVRPRAVKAPRSRGCSVYCDPALSPSFSILRVGLFLLGEKGDMILHCVDGKSCQCHQDEEHDDDDRDGDVALDHLVWRRSADRGREVVGWQDGEGLCRFS